MKVDERFIQLTREIKNAFKGFIDDNTAWANKLPKKALNAFLGLNYHCDNVISEYHKNNGVGISYLMILIKECDVVLKYHYLIGDEEFQLKNRKHYIQTSVKVSLIFNKQDQLIIKHNKGENLK